MFLEKETLQYSNLVSVPRNGAIHTFTEGRNQLGWHKNPHLAWKRNQLLVQSNAGELKSVVLEPENP